MEPLNEFLIIMVIGYFGKGKSKGKSPRSFVLTMNTLKYIMSP